MTQNTQFPSPIKYYANAVIRGFVADFLLKLFLQMGILIFVGGYLISNGMTENEFVEFILKPPLNSWTFILLNLVAIISAMFGGFVAGRVAKISELMVSVILALINLFSSILLFVFDTFYPSLIFFVIVVVSFIATIQGGCIAKRLRLNSISKP